MDLVPRDVHTIPPGKPKSRPRDEEQARRRAVAFLQPQPPRLGTRDAWRVLRTSLPREDW